MNERHWNFFILLTLMGLILSPNLFLFWVMINTGSIALKSSLAFIVTGVVLNIIVLTLFKKFWLSITILLPLFFLVPFELLFNNLYSSPSNANVLAVVLETNLQESFEFLSGYEAYLIISIALFIIFPLIATVRFKNNGFQWSNSFRRKLLIICLALLGLLFVKKMFNEEFSWEKAYDKWVLNISRTYSVGVWLRFYELYQERKFIRAYHEKTHTFSFDAYVKKPQNEREIYILVIGESSRYGNWGVNGYYRKNSPVLSAQKDLISYSDVIASSPSTLPALAILMTRAGVNTFERAYQEKPFISTFNEAGFSTFWLSNTTTLSKTNTLATAYAKESDETRFCNVTYRRDFISKIKGDPQYDSILLAPLQEILDNKQDKIFVVLHTLGNHYNYSLRYPELFEKFIPSIKNDDTYRIGDGSKKQLVINAYDNSIYFIDHFLGKIIGLLQKNDSISTMMFVSDHGENLYDDDRKLSGHGHGTYYDLHIPLFVWVSEKYKSHYPEKYQALKVNKNKKISLENIFSSILDISGIGYQDENLAQSIASPYLKETQRFFRTLNNDIIAYDKQP